MLQTSKYHTLKQQMYTLLTHLLPWLTQRDDAYVNFIDLCESLASIYCLKTSNPHHEPLICQLTEPSLKMVLFNRYEHSISCLSSHKTMHLSACYYVILRKSVVWFRVSVIIKNQGNNTDIKILQLKFSESAGHRMISNQEFLNYPKVKNTMGHSQH
jgi:hypothetical protein